MRGVSICILLVFRSLFVVGRHIAVYWGLNFLSFLFRFTDSFVDIAGVVYDFSVTIS